MQNENSNRNNRGPGRSDRRGGGVLPCGRGGNKRGVPGSAEPLWQPLLADV